MNIEITDLDMILNYLETTSLESHDDYSSEFTYKDQKILYKYIKQLQQEVKKQKAQIEKYQKALDETMSEKIDIQNNWNKLKEIIKKKQDYYRHFKDNRYRKFLSELLDIMQEKEQGSDSNDSN